MHAEPPSASFFEFRPIGGGPVMWSVLPYLVDGVNDDGETVFVTRSQKMFSDLADSSFRIHTHIAVTVAETSAAKPTRRLVDPLGKRSESKNLIAQLNANL